MSPDRAWAPARYPEVHPPADHTCRPFDQATVAGGLARLAEIAEDLGQGGHPRLAAAVRDFALHAPDELLGLVHIACAVVAGYTVHPPGAAITLGRCGHQSFQYGRPWEGLE